MPQRDSYCTNKMPVDKNNVSDDNLLDSQDSQETEEEITEEILTL